MVYVIKAANPAAPIISSSVARMHVGAAFPAPPNANGDMFYNTADNTLYVGLAEKNPDGTDAYRWAPV